MHSANPPLPGTLLYQSLGISEVREVGKEHQSKANPKEKPVSSVLCDPAAHLIYLVLMSKFFSYSLSYLFFQRYVLFLVLSNCFLLQGTEKDFCGREDVTTGNS